MNELSNIFIKNYDNAKAKKQNIIQGEKYRFTILSPRLVRLEYNKAGIFVDEPTGLVINRNFDINKYSISESNLLIEVKTEYFTLIYAKDEPFIKGKIAGPSTLKVVLNGTDKEWYYKHPEAQNFKGYCYSLEDIGNGFRLKNGLYSGDGFATLDDSTSLILSKDGFYKNRNGGVDIYLFMYKKDFGFALTDYFTLTGYPIKIPRYAFGIWWYKNEKYTSKDIMDVVSKFEENNITLSAFLLGDWWHNSISPLSIDEDIINEKDKLMNYLHQKNIHLGLTINPSLTITKSDKEYQEVSNYVDSSSIKLTPLDNQKLELFLNVYYKKMKEFGVDFFNIDYKNEKEINSLWLLQHYLLAGDYKNEQGFVISPSSGIAMHRYPICYTGKSRIGWDILNILPYYTIVNANIGVSFVAHAYGGYLNGIETKELYIRYIQLATFSPIFLLASEGGKYYKKEPWKWDNILMNVICKYMILRNRLVPFLYTASYIYHKTGENLVKPLYYNEPKLHDEVLYRNEYFLGNEFLICPITKKKNLIMNRVVQKLYIPTGLWYDYFTGKKYPGGKYYTSFYKDDDYPVFCKAGSIIPLSIDNNTLLPVNMEIEIFPGASNSYTLYEDGTNCHFMMDMIYDYSQDKYKFTMKPKEGNANILPKRNYRFRFRNTRFTNLITVLYNGSNVKFNSCRFKNDLIIDVYSLSLGVTTEIIITGENLESSPLRAINEEIASILDDLEITTNLKEKIDEIIFSDLPVKNKRIAIRKLKKEHLDTKFINMFINLLSYIDF